MKRVALYRKYRPTNFDEVFGQKPIIKTLSTSIQNGSITHAYIFSGNKGSGKTTIAKIFSKAINCLSPVNANPCNQCENCKAINEYATTDFIEMDAASNNGVDEIRNIINLTNYMPNKLKYKVYIVDEAHMLTTNSWNALLKTLEEPPSYVIFIFATTEFHKIPPTIISRCQRYDFNKLTFDNLNDLIDNVCNNENISIDKECANAIIRLSDGAARDALSIIDQVSCYAGNTFTINDINDLFGLVSNDNKIQFINAIINKENDNALELLSNYLSKGINIALFLGDILDILMDKLIFLKTTNFNKSVIISREQSKALASDNENVYLNLINLFSEALQKSKSASNPKFVIEYYTLKALSDSFVNNNQHPSLDIPKNKVPNTSEVVKQIPQTISNEEKNSYQQQNDNQVKKPEITNKWADMVSENKATKPSSSFSDLPEFNTAKTFKTKELDLTKELNTNIGPKKQHNIDEIMSNQPTTEFLFANNEKTKPLEYQNFAEFENINNIKQDNKTKTSDSTKSETNHQPIIENKTINFDNVVQDEQIITDYTQEVKDKFFAIAANHESNLKEELNKRFSIIKDFPSASDYEYANIFLLADKFLITSKNGAALLFENKSQAINFNKIATTSAFNNYFEENFKTSKVIIGIDKEIAKIYKDEFKKIKENNIKDVKINKENNDKKTMLLDILNNTEE